MTARADRAMIWTWSSSNAAAAFAARMARQIRAQQPDRPLILALHAESPAVASLRADGFVLDLIDGEGSIRTIRSAAGAFPDRFRRFAELLERQAPDTIVVPMNFGLAWPLAERLRNTGRRLIYVCHDGTPHDGDYATRMLKFTQNRLIGRADRVLFLSSEVKEAILARRPDLSDRSYLVPLGDFGWRTDAPDRRPLRVDGPLRFLFAGRMIRYKGLETLLRAASMLGDRPGWTLTLAGQGPLASKMLARSAGNPCIDTSNIGLVSDEKFASLLAEHDVLVCPYDEASQSGVVCEAIYAGLPCIVADVGALPAQIGHGKAGWIIPRKDPSSLSDLMMRLVQDRGDVARASDGALSMASDGPGACALDWLDP